MLSKRTILVLSCLVLAPAACSVGPDIELGADTSESSSSGVSETGEAGESGETGEPEPAPDGPCAACGPDELCVGVASSDSCGGVFGNFEVACVPAPPTCDEELCSEACVEWVCGGGYECSIPCEPIPAVDLWCSAAWTVECDPVDQDCPEGEKCVPHASAEGRTQLDSNTCVPILGDQAPGQPCQLDSLNVATDDCDATSYCHGVDDEGAGICRAFCGPDLSCEEDGFECQLLDESVFPLCLPLP